MWTPLLQSNFLVGFLLIINVMEENWKDLKDTFALWWFIVCLDPD